MPAATGQDVGQDIFLEASPPKPIAFGATDSHVLHPSRFATPCNIP